MMSYSIKELLEKQPVGDSVEVNGWVKTFRSNRFIALNDGSTIHNLQCVVDFENLDEGLLKQISSGAALKVTGTLEESQGRGQRVEIQATDIFVHGTADPETYPIQPKKHSLEFLREKAHLRVRTNTFSAVMRVRSVLSFAVHSYFQQNGFYYMHAPIITGSDAEGAGEMFRVTNLDMNNPPLTNDKVNEWGLRLYEDLAKNITDLKSINNRINNLVEGFDLKKIILAKPYEISRILKDHRKNSELDKVIKPLYKNYKHLLFDILQDKKGSDLTYYKRWLFNNIAEESDFVSPNRKPFRLRYVYPVYKYGNIFSLSIYNFSRIDEFVKLSKKSKIDSSEDFFGKETNLTVSGQLEAETYAMGLGKVYTFGPTFRAENSNTSRHLAEFWMIEPEMAFFDLDANMDLAEDFIKYIIQYVLDHCQDDLQFLEKRLLDEEKTKPQTERSEMALIEKLKFVVENNFKRVSYTEAIDILKNSKPNKKKKFQFPIDEWGADLQSEHERFLVEKHFKCPVILFDYPANIKAFYMRLNEDGKTVRAMDVLFPGIGEIVGGSQREERLDVLEQKIKELDIDAKELWWYLDLRKFGTAVHSGFGLGFERMVQFATGMGNIRDVIPYPRTPQNAEF